MRVNYKLQVLRILLTVLVTGACSLLAAGGVMAQGNDENRIAVMPFIKGKNPENIEETMTCPYSSFCYEETSLLPQADGMLTRMVQSVLNREFSGQVVPLEQAGKMFEVLKIDHAQDTPRTVVLRLGETLKTDYMLAGNVWRFRERVGTAFSAERPASVCFWRIPGGHEDPAADLAESV